MKTKRKVNHGMRIIFTLLFLALFSIGFSQVNDTVMVTVSAGEFEMGCNYNDPDNPCVASSYPPHMVYIDEFRMDKYMVTYRRYNQCIEAGECTELYFGGGCNAGMPWNEDHPVNCVDYNQAKAFCEWEGGKRLPTEAEWEKAARGTDGKIFPWGNEAPNCNLTVMNDQPFVPGVMGPGCGSGTTQAVGSKPDGASPYGVTDMVGNLWEWTQDWYSDDYFQNSPYSNPQGPESGDFKALKGGSWTMRHSSELAATVRWGYAPLGQGYMVGFRCVKSGITGFGEIKSNPLLKIYPNPSTGIVTVEGDKIDKIEVINNEGKTIRNELVKAAKCTINLQNEKAGVYFIKAYAGKNFASAKIILNK